MVLVGEIGAGKTTFAQGFGIGLGVDEPITSPTFVLLHSYDGRIPLHHVDIYRLDHLQEVIDIGLVELLDEGGVALVEWGDLASPVLPRDYLEIRLELAEDDEARSIELRGVGSDWVEREGQLADHLRNWVVEP
jgi:tRNA threonylcarbamoyladenosine biosynthesis protein TsaE